MAAYITMQACLILFLIYTVSGSKISDLRLCADKKCEAPVSYATALMKFNKMEPGFLRFKGGEMITIFSKSAGSKPELWGGQTRDGKRGYFPKAFVKEHKVQVSSPEFTVPTEDVSIESQLGIKKVETPKPQDPPQQRQPDEGGGDDTEIDDTEIPDEPEDSQATATPPVGEVKAESHQEQEQQQDSGNIKDETELDETEFEDEAKDNQADISRQNTDVKSPPEDDTEFDEDVKDDTDLDKDDTELDKDDVDDTEIANDKEADDEGEEEDFMEGMDELDNFFDLHENIETPEDVPQETTKEQEQTQPPQDQQQQQQQQQPPQDQQQQQQQQPPPGEQQQQQPSQDQQHQEQQHQQHLTGEQQQPPQNQEQQYAQPPQGQQHQEQLQQQMQQELQQQHQQQMQQQQQWQQEHQLQQQQQEQQMRQQQQEQPLHFEPPQPPAQFDQQHHDQQNIDHLQNEQAQQVINQQQQQQVNPVLENVEQQLGQLPEDQKVLLQQQIDQFQQQQQANFQQQQDQLQKQTEFNQQAGLQPDANQQQQQVNIDQQQHQQQYEPQHQQHAVPTQEPHAHDPIMDAWAQQASEIHQPKSQEVPPPVELPVLTTLPPSFVQQPPSADSGSGVQGEGHQDGGTADAIPPQTGSEHAGSMEEIVKSEAPQLDEQQQLKELQQEEQQQQHQAFDPNMASSNVFVEPQDISFTQGDIPSEQVLSSSMQEQPSSASVATPDLNTQATLTQDLPQAGSVSEVQEQNPRETVIDGTTIPLFDDMEDDSGLSTPVNLESSPTVADTEITSTESQYAPQVTDLPFVDEPAGFEAQEEFSVNEPVKVTEEKNEETQQEAQKEEEFPLVEDKVDLVDNDTNEENPKEPETNNIVIEPTVDQMYSSDDFISRKPLSVGQGHPPQQNQPPAPPADASRVDEVPPSSQTSDTTPTPPDMREIPPPPSETTTLPPETTTLPQETTTLTETTTLQDVKTEEVPPVEDPYETGVHVGRQFTEDRLEEDLAPKEGMMRGLESSMKGIIDKLPPSLQSFLEQEPLGLSPTLFVLVTIATVISLFTVSLCGCICGGSKKKGKKDPLVVVREIEEKLFIATKEKENLEDELVKSKNERAQLEKRVRSNESSSGGLQTDLQNVQLHNEALKTKVTTLQSQLDDATSQLSSNKNNTQSKDKQVKNMEKQISKLEEKFKKAQEDLENKTREVKDSGEDMKTLKGQIKSLTEQVKQLETSKQTLLSEADDWKEKVSDLKERGSEREEEMKQMQETLAFKDNEMEVLKDCFRQLKVLGDEDDQDNYDQAEIEEKIQKMMDVSGVNASLRGLEDERDSLSNRLQIETDARKEVEDQLAKTRGEIDSLQTDKMKSDRQCQESQMKLNVLSNYFKEKEAQLQRELGEHEALKKQNVNKLENIDEHAKMMEEEVEMYKTQIESLKRELTSSERDFRAQIAANEKKAHENWLAARSAERELKEVRHDAGVLRQRLTDVERRPMMGPGGLIRPLPTRGMPPPGMMNGPPPPPGMERSPSRGSIPPPPPHLRDDREEFRRSPHERLPPPPDRRPPPPGSRLPPPDGRTPPPGDRLPPGSRHPPHIPEGRSPPPFDRRPPHPMDRRTPPYRPPPDMMPSPRGPPMFGASSPPPRMPPPPGVDPRLGPRTSSPQVRPPPPGRDGRPPRQHSQV